MDIVYNIIEDYKNDITDTNLKDIINKKLLKIILFMESCTNEAN